MLLSVDGGRPRGTSGRVAAEAQGQRCVTEKKRERKVMDQQRRKQRHESRQRSAEELLPFSGTPIKTAASSCLHFVVFSLPVVLSPRRSPGGTVVFFRRRRAPERGRTSRPRRPSSLLSFPPTRALFFFLSIKPSRSSLSASDCACDTKYPPNLRRDPRPALIPAQGLRG